MSRSIAATRFVVLTVAFACGSPSSTRGDANGTDGSIGDDGSIDAPPDGVPVGPLTPDPQDPVSLPCAGTIGFPNPAMVLANSGRPDLLLGDVDGDGTKDLVFRDGDGVKLSLGNGNGTFRSPTLVISTTVSVLRLANVDTNATLDLIGVITSGASYEVVAALNNGSGGFGALQTVYSSTTHLFGQVDVVDLDGDGKRDLVGLDTFSDEVVVLIASGGSFAAPQIYTAVTGLDAGPMAVADVTGDSRADVVVLDSSGAVSVLTNNGNGTFANRVAYPTPTVPSALVLADANEDGKLDIVVGTLELNVGQISVLLNQGTGTFGPVTSYPLTMISSQPRALAAADVNGDGFVDIGAAYSNNTHVHVLLGNGMGQFNTALSYPFSHSASIALADLQGDGHADMVLYNDRGVAPYLSSGTSAPFEAYTPIGFGARLSNSAGARLLDLDGDTRLDLVGMGYHYPLPSSVMTRLAAGGATYGPTTTYATLAAGRTMLADIDNNGHLDLVMSGAVASGYGVQTLLNQGNGSLTVVSPLPIGYASPEMDIADLDQDGIRDLVVADAGPPFVYASEVRYHRGFGNGHFGPGIVLWTGNSLNGVVIADLNGDGKRDLVIGSYNNGNFGQQVLLALGNGSFAAPVVTAMSGAAAKHLYARDINRDGHLDTIGIDLTGVVVTLGDGTGSLGAPIRTVAYTHEIWNEAAFADVNGDGHLDVVTLGYRSTVIVLLGRGDGTFHPPLSYESTGVGASVSVGDLNEDGRLDVFIRGGYFDADGHVSILYGRCW